MGRSASRGLFLLSVVALIFFSLRPSPLVDLAFDVALMPVRVLAEVVRPARLLHARSVRAADTRLAELHESDLEAREQLFLDSSAYVVPEQPALTDGRRFVHAEVIERVQGDVDRIILQVERGSCAGLEPGMPVISGEVFVGRLQAVDAPRQGLATVDLVTRKGFFVGGIGRSQENDFCRDANGPQVNFWKFLLRKIERGRCLPAVYYLHSFHPENPGTAIACFSETNFVRDDDNPIVVGHETTWIVSQGVPNSSVHLSCHTEK